MDDVVVASRTGANFLWNIYLYRGAPSGLQSVVAWSGLADGDDQPHMASGDTNGDGYGDIAVCDGYVYGTSQCTVLVGNSSAQLTNQISIPEWYGPAGRVPAFVDLNGDGLDDLAIALSSRVDVHRGRPGFVAINPTWSWRASHDQLASADFNGDGYGDLWADESIVYGSPGGPLGPIPVGGLGRSPIRWVASPDVDGDGLADLLASNSVTPGIVGVLRSGNVIPTLPGPLATWGGPNNASIGWVIAAGDFNGDGFGDRAFTVPNQRIAVMFGP
ncbi:MAG: VCBS repeat-containing protein [Alphaproteobacteria bacterium]|nr:VCBS repeat-containing protein [Alphaproteobacteria bacterium]